MVQIFLFFYLSGAKFRHIWSHWFPLILLSLLLYFYFPIGSLIHYSDAFRVFNPPLGKRIDSSSSK